MYNYVANKDERKQLRESCVEIILCVQRSELKEYFTFQFKLIGSGETQLITQNGENGQFDLDYNFILQKDKKGLISSPQKVKDLFIGAFNSFNKDIGFQFASNSTSVITSKLVRNDKLYFSFDVAILCEGNNGNLYKLIYDKNVGRYIWNEIKSSRNYLEKITLLKQKGRWVDVKDLYLQKKNMHLVRQDQISSFSVLLETLNELCDREGISV